MFDFEEETPARGIPAATAVELVGRNVAEMLVEMGRREERKRWNTEIQGFASMVERKGKESSDSTLQYYAAQMLRHFAHHMDNKRKGIA